jgi:hypothetical protein
MYVLSESEVLEFLVDLPLLTCPVWYVFGVQPELLNVFGFAYLHVSARPYQ